MPTLSEMPEVVGFKENSHPTGWYQIGWTDDLKPGDVRPIKYFSKDLVLYRTESGRVVVQSAFCPHMGAHLGHGGTVCEETIVCPYHSWRWDTDGANTFVPALGGRSTTSRMLEKYETSETCGIIWMWYDARNRAPMWAEPPEMRKGQNYLPLYPGCVYRWESQRYKPQYVVENTIDLDHLISVHRNTLLPEKRSKADYPPIVAEGPIMYLNRPQDRTPEQNAHPVLPIMGANTIYGPGVIAVDFPPDPDRPWRKPCILLQCTTPVDEDHSDGFANVLVEQDDTVEGAGNEMPVGTALKRVKEQIFQAGVDFPIWNNMIWLNQPAYTPVEAIAFNKIRVWFSQFYANDDAESAATQSKVASLHID